MKAKEFFEMVRKVRAAQKTYYKSRLQGDLIASKQLESQLDKAIESVIKDGGLEPDDVHAAHRMDAIQYQEYLRLVNEAEIREQLDLSEEART